jgi:hypothetical protein
MTGDGSGGPGWSPTRRNDDAPPSTTSTRDGTPEVADCLEPVGSHGGATALAHPPVTAVLGELRAIADGGKIGGQARSDENTDDWWRSTVDQAIRFLARTGRAFDAYAVAELGVPEPDHPNRWGPRFTAAARAGIIEPVGYAKSRRPTVAGAAVRVWRGAR